MAVAYKNASGAVGVSYATVYTCPASTEAVVSHIQVTNVDGTNDATGVGVRWHDNSAAVDRRLIHNTTVPAGQALDVLGGGVLHLEASDTIQAIAGATSDIEITVTVMEVS